MVQISRSMLVALLLATVLIFGSTLASGHGNNGFGLGMTSGGSFGGSGGHSGGRTSQDSGGASNTIPRRDGYGVTTIHHPNNGVSHRYFFRGQRAKEMANSQH